MLGTSLLKRCQEGGTVNCRGRSLIGSVAVTLLIGASSVLPAFAQTSQQDLMFWMQKAMEEELPADVKTIGFWHLENKVASSLDIDLFREDLEIAIIQSKRFVFVNRELLGRALKEMNLCTDLGCLVNPQYMQQFGRAQGIDALVYGEIIDASEAHPELAGTDYYVTVELKAISTATSAIIWAKEITGVNLTNIRARIGRLPDEDALWREEGFARQFATFLRASEAILKADVRTILFLQFEDRSGAYADMGELYRALGNAVVRDTGLKLVDRGNLEQLLKEQQLVLDSIVDPSRRSQVGQLYGVDAFVFGRIRKATPDSIVCAVRVSDVESNVDLDAKVVSGVSKDTDFKLVNLLRNAGPSFFGSTPTGAEVSIDGNSVGRTPLRYQLGDGPYEVVFRLESYAEAKRTIQAKYGRPDSIVVELERAMSLLTVTSSPESATVFLDDTAIGTTPLSAVEVRCGTHGLRLQKEHYEDLSEQLDLSPGAQVRHYELKPEFGTVFVEAAPTAQGWVILDDGPTGEATPVRLEFVPPGSHTITAARCGQDGSTKSISVRVGEETQVLLDLAPKTPARAALRAVVLPGWGQHYKGQRTKGYLLQLGALGAASAAVVGFVQRENAVDDFRAAQEQYGRAVVQADIDHWFSEMDAKLKDADSGESLRNVGYAALATVWVLGIVDAALGFPLSCDDDEAMGDAGRLGEEGIRVDGLPVRIGASVRPFVGSDPRLTLGLQVSY